MAGADDQVFDATITQEEADYAAAIDASTQESNTTPHSAASQVPLSSSAAYLPAAPTYSLPAIAPWLQYQAPAQSSAGQSTARSIQFSQQRNPSIPALGELGLTPQQVESAPPLDFGLDNLLRHSDVKEAVIQAFRVRGITDRLLFVAIDDTTEGLRNTCREALGVDATANFEHKLEFANLHGMELCEGHG